MKRRPHREVTIEGARTDAGTRATRSSRANANRTTYRLVDELSSGDFAKVHFAVQQQGESIRRVVVVEQLHPHLWQNQAFREMLIEEASIAARINHRSAAGVLDVVEDADGCCFIVREYLLGEPLWGVTRALQTRADLALQPRHPFLMARIAADVAAGLDAAHGLGRADKYGAQLVHRALSPQNLFVLYDGAVRVLDFGWAQARDRAGIQDTLAPRDLAYLAPEQVLGHALDHRVDIWSLGVVLWELLALRPLFGAPASKDALLEAMRGPISPPSRFNPHVPEELDNIVAKALSVEPQRRHESARQLARELERCIAGFGESVGSPELSGWLSELIPEGLERASTRMRNAIRGGEAGSQGADGGSPPRELNSLWPRPDRVESPLPSVELASEGWSAEILEVQPVKALRPGPAQRPPSARRRPRTAWILMLFAALFWFSSARACRVHSTGCVAR